VPGKVERIGLIARRDERQLHIRVQGAGDIAQIAIHARGYGGLGKAGANGGSNISRRCAFWHFPNGTIGQADFEHLSHSGGYALPAAINQPMAAAFAA